MTYDFRAQLAAGAEGERRLDEFFAEHWDITPATPAEQRLGIDRWFEDRELHERGRIPVEYKTDWKAAQTHNAFVETVSVDTAPPKAGWAYTSQAEVLMYLIPGDELLYIIRFEDLRAALPGWLHYPTGRSPNDGYETHGLLVPLAELERVALEAVSL